MIYHTHVQHLNSSLSKIEGPFRAVLVHPSFGIPFYWTTTYCVLYNSKRLEIAWKHSNQPIMMEFRAVGKVLQSEGFIVDVNTHCLIT